MSDEFSDHGESSRLDALHSYDILDTPSEVDFDEITNLAAAICNTPIALVSFVDKNRQWFKSVKGLDLRQTARSMSFCTVAIQNPKQILQVENTHQDDRFKSNPLVTGDPKIGFYAGMSIVDESGHALGTVCVIDTIERKLTADQEMALRILSKQIAEKLTLRKRVKQLEVARQESKTFEQGLLRTEKYLRNVINQAPTAIVIFSGSQMIIDSVNPLMLTLLNKDEGIKGKAFLEVLSNPEDQEVWEILREIYRTGQPMLKKDQAVSKRGTGKSEIAYYDYIYTPIVENNAVVGIINMATEVTDRVINSVQYKENEAKLLETNGHLWELNNALSASELTLKNLYRDLGVKEARLQYILDSLGEGVGITDEKGNIVYTNRRNQEIFQVNKDDMLKLSNTSVIWGNKRLNGTPLPDDEHPVTITLKTGETVRNFEFLVRDSNGTSIYLSMNTSPIKNDRGEVTGAIASFSDISERILLHQRLTESRESLQMALASANLGTWYINADTLEFLPSDRLKELFGFYADDEMPYEAAIEQIVDSHRTRVTELVNAAIESGEPYDLEYPIIGFHDKKLRWVHATGRLYAFEGEEKKSHFSGTIADITSRKMDEQRRNDLIAMVSHELRTPLTSLSGYLQILTGKIKRGQNDTALELGTKAQNQVDKMIGMVKGFLDVARSGEGKIYLDTTRFDMSDLIQSVQSEMSSTVIGHSLLFSPVEKVTVEADFAKIEQVIVNFIGNSIKYARNNSPINISCFRKSNSVVVEVKDEGVGVSERDQRYIFDRFYRAENSQVQLKSGFGIGLYICKEIIIRHGGEIGVSSELGRGSTFWFSLPLTSENQKYE
ncbi:ATP-binding protein [Sphingobacterium corticis]|uniref:histidine kinase n=1 Tax=Sphingobacterium corticis TaxID=1812823 RepID=A0ABW5NKE4_9SPHI